jgi:RNA polymerase sigma-70 factor (ECF subfamily)
MEEDFALPLPRALAMKDADARGTGRSNEEIVTALYEQLRPALVGYVYHLTGSSRDAEDLVQIAFLQFFDQLNRRAEIRNVRGWIYRAVHSLAVNHVTRSRRHDSLIREWLADAEGETVESAEEALARRDEIVKALQLVNERERHCLMLRAEGLSYQEIAEVLEISAKSVSVYLARGLRKFENRHEQKK